MPLSCAIRAALVGSMPYLACGACGAPPEPPDHGRVTWTLEPDTPLDAASIVVRLHFARLMAAPASLLFFEGEVGAYHSGQLRDGELSSALAERRVPAITWRDAAGDAILAPSRVLEPGSSYSVAVLGRGVVGTLRTARPSARPYAARVWPPSGAPGLRSVYCGELPAPVLPAPIRLEPGGVEVALLSGVDGEGSSAGRCLHWDVPSSAAGAGVAVPPVEYGAILLDPSPVALGVGSYGSPLATGACPEGWAAFGPGCADVQDDRAIVRLGEPRLWALVTGGAPGSESVHSSSQFVLTGLEPSSQVEVRGTVTDVRGLETAFRASLQTAASRPHIVLNEVLANPIGPEPAQEWVELLNDGRLPTNLGGFVLGDAGGEVLLPPAVLPPGGFALVVNDSFDAADGFDVAPAGGTLLLRVPRLGQSGLSNAGEGLRLSSPQGEVVSTFPPVPAATAGRSVARSSPTSLDDDRAAFAPSRTGEASPGWPNGAAER